MHAPPQNSAPLPYSLTRIHLAIHPRLPARHLAVVAEGGVARLDNVQRHAVQLLRRLEAPLGAAPQKQSGMAMYPASSNLLPCSVGEPVPP